MKKILILLACGFAVVLLACGGLGIWFWRSMGEAMYRPGMVRAGENLRGPLQPPEQSAEGQVFLVEPDIQLAYEATGEGRPVLVIHGGPGFPYERPWEGLAPLADRYRFYYYHQRGCGDSTRPFDRFESRNYYANLVELERTLGVGAQIADIERIRRILKQERLILVGHSFGGFLATMYAAEFPDRVAALVLVAPAGVLVLPDEETDLMRLAAGRLPAEQQAAFQRAADACLDFGGVFSKSEAELARINRELGGHLLAAMGEPTPEERPTDATNGGWMVQAMYFSLGMRHDYRPALTAITCPVLIVHAEDDDLTRPGSRRYVDALPHARPHLISSSAESRAGHFVFNDQAEKFADGVSRFLETIGD